jgi:predicted N-acetyltransferase YhbS
MLTWLQRKTARNRLEAQLFPRLKLNASFRAYEERDRDACLEVYRKNAPGRFPEEDSQGFEEYLAEDAKALIVAEVDSRVVGLGGLTLEGHNVATLCYGIVDPAWQRKRLGATLTLLRITLLPPAQDGFWIFIHTLNPSLPIYEKFGFIECGKWQSRDELDHPSAVLHIPPCSHQRIKTALANRGAAIQNSPAPPQNPKAAYWVEKDAEGRYSFHSDPQSLKNRNPPHEPSH